MLALGLSSLALSPALFGQSQVEAWRNTGVNGSQQGGSFARLGDLNGDGVDDLAVGSATGNAVRLVSGATGATLSSFSGPSGSIWFGSQVGAIDDTHIVVGDPAAASFRGRVSVYDVTSTGAPLATYFGQAPNDFAGASVSDRLGDITGDGVPDFGFILRSGGAGQDRISIRSGAPGYIGLYLLSAPPGVDFAGGPVRVGDVFTSSNRNEFGVPGFGGARIYDGSNGAQLRLVSGIGRTSIIGLGDIDGDGADDYATGEPDENSGTGRARIYSGAAGSLVTSATGSASQDQFGFDIDVVSDHDGDGKNDLVVGAPQIAVNGTGYARVISSVSGCLISEFVPPSQVAAAFGVSVDSVGDLDGDGVDEVSIGASGWDQGVGANHGAVFTYIGNSPSGPVGTEFCHCTTFFAPCGNPSPTGIGGCENATGRGARMRAYCSASVSSDNLVLGVTGFKPNEAALIFMGNGNSTGPLDNGRKCVVGNIYRFPATFTDGDGSFTNGPGLAAYSATGFPAGGQIVAGSTWYFQAWARDGGGPCGLASNLSNAVAIPFLP